MEIRQYYLGQQPQKEQQNNLPVQPRFVPNIALAGASTGILQQAGRIGIGLTTPTPTGVMPMHNPYAQVPLVSRHWARRRFTAKA